VRLWRGTETFLAEGSTAEIKTHFPKGKYHDVPGLCCRVTREQIETHGWSLNPGRYVGVSPGAVDDEDYKQQLMSLNEELEDLNAQAHDLEQTISQTVVELLGM
jgi:type I restriction enzyme M protein